MDLRRQKILNDHKLYLVRHGRETTNAGWMSSLRGPPTPIYEGTPREVTSLGWCQHAAISIIDALLIGYSCRTTPANIAISAEEACIACETGIPLTNIIGQLNVYVHGDKGDLVAKPYTWRSATGDKKSSIDDAFSARSKAADAISAGAELGKSRKRCLQWQVFNYFRPRLPAILKQYKLAILPSPPRR